MTRAQKIIVQVAFVLGLLAFGFILYQTFWGNKSGSTADCTEVEPMPFELIRFDKELDAAKDKTAIKSLLAKYGYFSAFFLGSEKVPEDTLVAELTRLNTSPFIDTMNMDVAKFFDKQEAAFKKDLGQAFTRIKANYPDFKAPQVFTVVSGFGADLAFGDSLAVIGIETFLSDSGRYRMPNVPNYLLRRLNLPYLAPSLLLGLSNPYNASDLMDATLLGEMVRWGKGYYFVKQALPCTADSLVFGFSAKELAFCEKELPSLWAHFLKNRLLFDTNHMMITKYCGERPFINEISKETPGRLGRWLGYKIVEKYALETGKPLAEIMQVEKAQDLLNTSKFKP